MSLAIDDYVYVPSLGVYGRIENIGEETFYTVEFPWSFTENEVFEESELVKLENSYFPEGSIITGLKGVKAYEFTTDKAVMEVLWVEGDSMKVKMLSHETRPSSVGFIYIVEPIWFKLARPRTNFYRGEKED